MPSRKWTIWQQIGKGNSQKNIIFDLNVKKKVSKSMYSVPAPYSKGHRFVQEKAWYKKNEFRKKFKKIITCNQPTINKKRDSQFNMTKGQSTQGGNLQRMKYQHIKIFHFSADKEHPKLKQWCCFICNQLVQFKPSAHCWKQPEQLPTHQASEMLVRPHEDHCTAVKTILGEMWVLPTATQFRKVLNNATYFSEMHMHLITPK